MEAANESAAEDSEKQQQQIPQQQQQQQQPTSSDAAETPVERPRGEGGEGEEKEPMIAKDCLNVGMEVIEEGEEENGEEEKVKPQK